MFRLLLLTGAAVAGASCASSAPVPSGPRIESLDPSSGPAGEAYPIRLRITGGPFDSEGNRVCFGVHTIEDVASEDGRTLVVSVPKSVRQGDEAPPFVLPAGAYDVRVVTSAGTTTAVTFTLTPGGGT